MEEQPYHREGVLDTAASGGLRQERDLRANDRDGLGRLKGPGLCM